MSQRWTVEVSDTPEIQGMREKGLALEDVRRAFRDCADRSLHWWRRRTLNQMSTVPWLRLSDDYREVAAQYLPLAVLLNEMTITQMWNYDYFDHHPEPGTVVWDAEDAELRWYPRVDRSWYLRAFVPGEMEPELPDWARVD